MKLSAVLVAMLVVGCSTTDDVPDSTPEDTVGMYEAARVPPGQCQNPTFGCSSYMSLCADGQARLWLTDITNLGEWSATADNVAFTAVSAGDLRVEQVQFARTAEGLVDDLEGLLWTRTAETSEHCN